MKRTASIASGLAVALGVYAFAIEPRWLEVRRVKIHLRHLPATLEGLRIGLLTDLHAGSRRSLALVRRAAEAVMTDSPSIVAITGDFADGRSGSLEVVLEALSALTPPLGVFAVPGNHDHSQGVGAWREAVANHPGITDLTNRSVELPIGRTRLWIAGVDDLMKGAPSLESLPAPAERDLTILLAHNPDQAERCRRGCDGIDLVLSGHTHGGQIRLPGWGPVVSSVKHDELYEEGLRRRPWTQVYTSRGLGTVHLPARLLTRPEVSILELTRAPRPAREGTPWR